MSRRHCCPTRALELYVSILDELEKHPITAEVAEFLSRKLTPALLDPDGSDPAEVLAAYYEVRKPIVVIAATSDVSGLVTFVSHDGDKGEGKVRAVTLDGILFECPKIDCGQLELGEFLNVAAKIKAAGEQAILKGKAYVKKAKCKAKCLVGIEWVELPKKYRKQLVKVVSLLTLAELPDHYWR